MERAESREILKLATSVLVTTERDYNISLKIFLISVIFATFIVCFSNDQLPNIIATDKNAKRLKLGFITHVALWEEPFINGTLLDEIDRGYWRNSKELFQFNDGNVRDNWLHYLQDNELKEK
ncbi:hypothetical protein [Vibrio sp. B1FIG11]|uniref:hypothetical protein n=1 Tax=Vibrio sp. B1FIG11 TaxID=2751177 RepID=UPI0015F39DDD|nr:hypothetical protein [Vibrio sp. B1FIG11]